MTTPAPPPKNETGQAMVARLYDSIGFKPDLIAAAIMDELKVTGHARKVLFPWVRDRVQHACRRYERQQGQQRRERRSGSYTVRPQAKGSTPDITDPLYFLDLQVATLDGDYKAYGDLTADEHAWRARQLGRGIAAVQGLIRTHEWAAQAIAKHNVKTLRDIQPKVLASELPEEGVRAL